MKKFSIILTGGTIILLVLNFLYKENLFLKPIVQPLSNEKPILGKEAEAQSNLENSQEKQALKNEIPHISVTDGDMKEEKPSLSPEISVSSKQLNTPKTEKRLINLDISDIRLIFSSILFLSALGIVLFSKKDDSLKKWAFGIIGSLMGFWLK